MAVLGYFMAKGFYVFGKNQDRWCSDLTSRDLYTLLKSKGFIET